MGARLLHRTCVTASLSSPAGPTGSGAASSRRCSSRRPRRRRRRRGAGPRAHRRRARRAGRGQRCPHRRLRLRLRRRAREAGVRPVRPRATSSSTTRVSPRAAAAPRGRRSRTTGSGASASTCSASPTASHTFVPRMIASGEPGVVVNTSSGDGGIAPVPYAAVYAGKQGRDHLLHGGARAPVRRRRLDLRAAVFYPSGGSSTRACGRPTATARPISLEQRSRRPVRS